MLCVIYICILYRDKVIYFSILTFSSFNYFFVVFVKYNELNDEIRILYDDFYALKH